MKKLLLLVLVCVTITKATQAQEGSDCPTAVVVNALPFADPSLTSIPPDLTPPSTCLTANNFGATNACGNLYTTNNDFYYRFSPTSIADACIDISITSLNPNETPPSIFVVEGCPNTVGSYCVAQEIEPTVPLGGTTTQITVSLRGVKLEVGKTYYIVVSSIATTAAGANNCFLFNTSITRSTTCTVTTGDDCKNAELIPSIPYFSANETNCNNKDYLNIGNVCAYSYADGKDKVYKIVPDADYCVQFMVTTDEYYSQMALYDGCPTKDRSGCITYDSYASIPLTINANLIQGKEYYLVVSTDSNFSTGGKDNCMDYSLSIKTFSDSGKNCSVPILIDSLPYMNTNSTICKGDEYDNAPTCGLSTFYQAGEEIIYKYESPGNECVGITVRHKQTNFTSGGLYIYNNCPEFPGSTCLGADFISSFGAPAYVEYTFTGPQTVYIAITSSSQFAQVDFDLEIKAVDILGKNCNNPIVIDSLPFNNANTTSCKGDDFDNRTCAGGISSFYQGGRETMYIYDSPGNECIGIKLKNLSITGAVYMFDRCPEDPTAVCLGSAYGFAGDNVSFDYTVGAAPQRLYFAVSNAYIDENLEYALEIVKYNDVGSTCSNSIRITSLPFEEQNSTLCKGNDYTTPGKCTRDFYQNLNGSEVVYEYNSPGNECLTVSISGISTDYSTVYIFDKCPSDTSARCIAQDYRYPFFDNRKSGDYQFEITNTAPQTYYIVISSQFTDENPDYTIRINAVTVDPLGMNCATAVNIPSFPFSGSYSLACKGNDYNNTMLPNSNPYLNGNDVVLKFTTTQKECLVFTTKMSYRGGIFVSNACPDAIGVQNLISGSCEGACDSVVLEYTFDPGTYYITLAGFTGIIDMDFDLNIRRNGTPQAGAACLDCDDDMGCIDCANVGLEKGNFANWAAAYGVYATPNQTAGFVSNGINNPLSRHTIVSAGSHDPVVGPELQLKSPIGSRYVLRLGNRDNGAEAELLRFTYNVTADSKNFYYYYAVVFDDPNHGIGSNPYLNFRMYDQVGQEITCARYEVYADDAIAGFKKVDKSVFKEYYPGISYFSDNVLWKDWTIVAVPLDAYIGQSITIEFTTKDCSASAHFGYCYLDAYCGNLPFQTSSKFLCSGSTITITAPSGFSNYVWDTGETTQSIQVNAARSYNCRVTTVANCTYDIKFDVLGGELPIPDFTFNQAECSDSLAAFTNATTFLSSDTSHVKSIEWDFGDGSPKFIGLNPVHTFRNGPGTYTITMNVLSTNDCSASISKQITITDKAPLPELISTDSIKLCEFETLMLDAEIVNTGTYNWTGPNGFLSNIRNPSRPNINTANNGMYKVTLNLPNCPNKMDSIYLSVTPTPNISKSPDATVCSDTLGVQLSASGANAYEWYDAASGGALLSATSSYFTGSLSSDISVFVSGKVNTCASPRKEIKIKVNPVPPNPIASNITLCAGKDTFLSAGNGGIGVIQWYSNASGSGFITEEDTFSISNPQSSSRYFARAKSANCYSAYIPVDLIVKSIPALPNVPNGIVCEGFNTVLTNTSVDGNTEWFTDLSTITPFYTGESLTTSNLSTNTTYFVRNNLNNCFSAIEEVMVEVTEKPLAPLLSPVTICAGATATLNGTSNLGEIEWFVSSSSQTPIYQGGTYTTPSLADTSLFYAQSNFKGCISDKVSTQVNVNPIPLKPIFTAPDSLCLGSGLSLSIGNVDPLASYRWVLPDQTEVLAPILTLNQAQSGEYTVNAIKNGCLSPISSSSIKVIAFDNAAFNYDKPAYCRLEGSTAPIFAGTSQGIFENLSTTGVLKFNQVTGVIDLANSTAGIYDLKYTTNGFCPASQVSSIQIDAINSATFSYNDPYCQTSTNGSAVFPHAVMANNATAGTFSTLQQGLVFSNASTGEIDLSQTLPGTYTILNQVTSVNACPDVSFSKSILVLKKPSDPIPSITSPICEGSSFTLSIGDDQKGTVVWSGSNGFSDNKKSTTIQNAQIGVHDQYNYNVYIKLGNCESNVVFAPGLKIEPAPVPMFNYALANEKDLEINVGDTLVFTNTTLNATEYVWFFGDNETQRIASSANVLHSYQDAGEYVVLLAATNTLNCANNKDIKLRVLERGESEIPVENSNLSIPNAFSPNADGINDVFELNLYGISSCNLRIYNRWGEMMYEETNNNPTWNGYHNDNVVPNGVYVYRYLATGVDGKTYKGFGTVTVYR